MQHMLTNTQRRVSSSLTVVGVKKTQLPVDQLLREKRRPTDKVKGQFNRTIVHCTAVTMIAHVDGEEGVAQASSQGGHWPGLNAALLDKLLLGSVEKGLLSGAVSSKKSSVAHSSVISARDTALQVSQGEMVHGRVPTSPVYIDSLIVGVCVVCGEGCFGE